MSRILIFRLAFTTLLLHIQSAKSQADHFAFTVTALNKGGTEWVAIRKLDTRTGEFGPVLLNIQDNDLLYPQPAPGNSVAALAFDRRANRLYYTHMTNDQLHYIDLNNLQVVKVPEQFFSKAGHYILKNDGPVNRMVIAPDDFGYTITNDGTHLLRFSTHGTPVLTDMGDLTDDPLNKEMSIHSICANSGGDLIADDAGHLYLITGYSKVFRIEISSRTVSYLGTISGLPQKFTTSGAAVGEDGKHIWISSSTYADGSFVVDPETWTASTAPAREALYESADLANSNVLLTKSNSNLFIGKEPENRNRISIFPNPVMEDLVSIQFHDLPQGRYTIQLVSLLGNTVMQQNATLKEYTQTETMHISGYTAQGFYYIRVLDEKNNVVGTQKLVVER